MIRTSKLQAAIVAVLLSLCPATLRAQQVALKTNLLYAATATPNLGLETGVGRKHSLQLFYGLNPWKQGHGDSRKYWKHWVLNPEYRYWFCHRFNGAFVGVHAFGGQFDAANVKLPLGMWDELKDHRFEGWYAGAGISYGYQWVLSRHWNVEAALGLGAAYIDYLKFSCGVCGKKENDGDRLYFGPTKAALSLVYLF